MTQMAGGGQLRKRAAGIEVAGQLAVKGLLASGEQERVVDREAVELEVELAAGSRSSTRTRSAGFCHAAQTLRGICASPVSQTAFPCWSLRFCKVSERGVGTTREASVVSPLPSTRLLKKMLSGE